MAKSYFAAVVNSVLKYFGSYTYDAGGGITANLPMRVNTDLSGNYINTRPLRNVFTLTTYTTASQVGDIICLTQELNDFFQAVDVPAVITGGKIQDKDDQVFGCEVIFFDANVSFGSAGAAPTISDANGQNEQYSMEFPQAGFKDRGGYKINKVSGYWLPVWPESGTTDLWAAVRLTEVPNTDATFTSSGLILTLYSQ